MYDKGLESLKAKDYRASEREFRQVFDSIDEHHALYNKVASYLGLSRVLVSDPNGLLLCRDAASSESADGDVFLNLACAEWHTQNRARALDALVRGRSIDSSHQQLLRAYAQLDKGQHRAVPFLSQENILNRFLGRIKRRDEAAVSVHSLLY